MTGLPMDHRSPTDSDGPPPAAPARRKLTIRERVDRELRSALTLAVDGEPRRPTKAWRHLTRAQTRPAGRLPERIEEYAAHGGDRERLTRALHEALDRALSVVFDGVAEQARQSA